MSCIKESKTRHKEGLTDGNDQAGKAVSLPADPNGQNATNIILVLVTELVPETSWYDNLRKVIARDDWDILRRRVYAEYGRRCGICRADAQLHCHEIWEYDESCHIQTLRGFIALCEMCHHVKHLGLASILANEGKLDYQTVIDHFCRVNGCDRATFDAHKKAAFDVWRERSRHPWTVELGEWAALIEPRQVVHPSEADQSGISSVDPLDADGVSSAPNDDFMSMPAHLELQPSTVTEASWVYAPPLKNSLYPRITERGGKWMIFVPMAELDSAWEKVKASLVEGQLGSRAKCSTAMPNPNASDPTKGAIIVYTYDGDDEADVWRVREGLRTIGFTGTLYWKSDGATRAGQYAVRGSRGVSRYRG